ncbi:hypothetical protein [Staphylococcus phage vB_StaM_SA1]|nr:hypothetical protein [Staphylococcus phage vB_StaM_SA1]
MSNISRKDAIDNYQYLNELFLEIRQDIRDFLSNELFKINKTDFKKSIVDSIETDFKVIETKSTVKMMVRNKFIEFDLYEGFIILYDFRRNIELIRENIDRRKKEINFKIDNLYGMDEVYKNNENELRSKIEKFDSELKDKIKLGNFTNALLNMLGMSNTFKLRKEIDNCNDAINNLHDCIKKNNREIIKLEDELKIIGNYDYRFSNERFMLNKINEFNQYFSNEYGFDFHIKYEEDKK